MPLASMPLASMPLASMTGFARTDGTASGLVWAWELRSVNGRGLDVRMRLTPGFEGLEPALRERAGVALKRGNVTANLTVKREERSRLSLDPVVLEDWLRLALEIAARIPGAPPPRPEALLALPGVLRPAAADENGVTAAQTEAVRDGFADALAGLVLARQDEGGRLHTLLTAQLDEVAGLHADATAEAADQPALQRARMLEAVAALLQDRALPEERIAQEVAILAIRSDVREELDRLRSHVVAARALLAEGVAVGRRFDFLVQEFVREVNTLCSKSASVALTTTGLRLKAVIEQMREQVQNVE